MSSATHETTHRLDTRSTEGASSAQVSLTPIATSDMEHPPLFVMRDELGFWTRAWQEGERESALARERGDLRTFESGADVLEWLDAPED